jgi:replicative DNA helicase
LEKREVNYSIYLENDYYVECTVLASVNYSVTVDDRSGMPDELMSLVDIDCFHSPDTKSFYSSIVDCRNEGKIASLANVALNLPMGYEEFIAKLVSHSTVPDIKEHCKRLVALRDIRNMTKDINRAYAILHDDNIKPSERVQESQSHLSQSFVTSNTAQSVGGSMIKDRLKGYFEIKEKKMQGVIAGIPTGLRAYDQDTGGMHGKQLIVVAGLSGMGKTNFVTTIEGNASRLGYVPALFTYEMCDEEMIDRLFSQRSKHGACNTIPNNKLMKGKELSTEDMATMMYLSDKISDEQFYIDDSHNITFESICSQCRKLKADHGDKFGPIAVDYLQLMVKDKDNATAEISRYTAGFKALSRELDTPILLLSQLNKRDAKVGERPHMGWLKGSGSIEADADIVVFPWREGVVENNSTIDRSEALLIWGKARGFSATDAPMKFCQVTTEFTDGTAKDF